MSYPRASARPPRDQTAYEAQPEYDDRSSENSEQSSMTWIAWFCSMPGHEYFCEVGEDFIEDDFNLTGLNNLVPFWKEAMEMVLDVESEDQQIPDVSIVEQSAEVLYGLVHARYILTRQGLQAMAEKYEAAQFGTCPRVFCMACPVLPCGRTDLPGVEMVKLYCPNCHDLYTPPSSRYQAVDGAFFGTTFPHLFFQTFRELSPAPFWAPGSVQEDLAAPQPFTNPNPHGGQKRAAGEVYTPRIYGFRVSERAKSGPRMKWLRMRPDTLEELDMVDWRGRWVNSDEEYDDDDDVDGPDGVMEDFDPADAADEDASESESEEEEDGAGVIPEKPAMLPDGKRRQRPLEPERAPTPTPMRRPLVARTNSALPASDELPPWGKGKGLSMEDALVNSMRRLGVGSMA